MNSTSLPFYHFVWISLFVWVLRTLPIIRDKSRFRLVEFFFFWKRFLWEFVQVLKINCSNVSLILIHCFNSALELLNFNRLVLFDCCSSSFSFVSRGDFWWVSATLNRLRLRILIGFLRNLVQERPMECLIRLSETLSLPWEELRRYRLALMARGIRELTAMRWRMWRNRRFSLFTVQVLLITCFRRSLRRMRVLIPLRSGFSGSRFRRRRQRSIFVRF